MNNSDQQLPIILRPLAKLNGVLSLLAIRVAGILLALMVVMILSQVFFRYVMNDSLPWTEEMAKFAMVWIAFLVAPWVYRQDLNVAIRMFADAFAPKVRQFADLVISILVIVICVIFLLESIEFWRGGLNIQASSVPVKLAYFYSCAPISFALLCSVGVEKVFIQLNKLLSNDSFSEQETP